MNWFFQNKSIKIILQVLLIKFIYFLLSFATVRKNKLKNSNIGQLKIELSDSFDMTCSNFTNHRLVRNLKFYRCLYFVLCIVFSGAYSNCILENLVRIYQTGHKQLDQNLYEFFIFVHLQFKWKKNHFSFLWCQNRPTMTSFFLSCDIL